MRAGSTRNSGRWPLLIGRTISFTTDVALGAILLIRIADNLGWTPVSAGSFSNAWSRLSAVGTRLGKYSSSGSTRFGVDAGLKEAVGWK